MVKAFNKKWWPAAFAALLFMPTNLSAGQDITPDEVRASYILKLRSFVTMGSPPHIMETICYYEKAGVPLKESVGQILAKYVESNPAPDGKQLAVKRFQAIRNITGCDAFYIPAGEDGNIDNILTALDASPTLTISDANRFILRGGMLGFVLDDANRVKMEANLENLKKRGVKIDAQILEIMQQVVGN